MTSILISSLGSKNVRIKNLRKRPTRTVTRLVASVSHCPHPDAVKRRQEIEAQRVQRAREHSETQMIQAMGLKWWEGALPVNMVAVGTPRELDAFSRQAFAAGRGVLINYFQEDCYTCRCLHNKLKQMATENPEVLFLKVNGSNEALRPIFVEQGITKVPYFQCVRDGVLLAELSASLNPEKLANLRKALAMVRARQVINA